MDYLIVGGNILAYQELDPNAPDWLHLPKLKDCLEKEDYDGKEKVIRYLETMGTTSMGLGLFPKDIFTGEKISKYESVLSDSVYSWSSVIPYYMRKYNLRMPKTFEDYILSKDF